jgi:hypothetical protein
MSDLNTLEARGAAFVTVPRHRRRLSVPIITRATQPHSRSQLSRLGLFGISAYGIIIIAAVLTLAIALVVLWCIIIHLFTRYS